MVQFPTGINKVLYLSIYLSAKPNTLFYVITFTSTQVSEVQTISRMCANDLCETT